MGKKVVIISGAAGFLGSSIAISLSGEYKVIGIDKRKPGPELQAKTPEVDWIQLNISRSELVMDCFSRLRKGYGRIDNVLHFAGYCRFTRKQDPEFELTNIQGTRNILAAAKVVKVSRLIFASSISVMEPPAAGYKLSPCSPTSNYIPYVWSKAEGEKILMREREQQPVIILRIGGIYSDWCELPPLYSLINNWSGRGLTARIIPGKGKSVIPFLHRSEFDLIVKSCLKLEANLNPMEVFLVSSPDSLSHSELYQLIQRYQLKKGQRKPVLLPMVLVKPGLFFRRILGSLRGKVIYERPWMLKFIDRPWLVDTEKTQKKLNWRPNPEFSLSEKLPALIENSFRDYQEWTNRNLRRISGDYIFSP